ncbi:hypothetical protein LTR62_005755 [Meristemomyces frigidus]|uniref:Myb-like domain-containing protein n=1 Tax=Meristemomyces frigidus TaxID=1508187 RepID=A0AAN7TCT6_9PEZI|nr:hypothetical protein LTR62_005755 [Meristemomyces frigidus]
MESRQPYSTLTGTVDLQQMCGDVTAGPVNTEWYAPTSYAYDNPYATQYTTSAIGSQQWPAYARSSVPEISTDLALQHQNAYTQPNIVHSYAQFPPGLKDPSRPRSSPSTFGPSVEHVAWPGTSGDFGISYASAVSSQPMPSVPSTFPPGTLQHSIDQQYSTSTASPPEMRHPQPMRTYPTIAPTPLLSPNLSLPKRSRENEDRAETSDSGLSKRRKRTSSVASADMSEDDRYLVHLKEAESLPWKDIATRFHSDKGKNFQVAALQMRYKRLREKYRTWQEDDINALRSAHEYWEKYKWEIISAKMLDFGLDERWPPRRCARKYQELETLAMQNMSTAGATPGRSQYSSPIDGPIQFAFVPIP